MTSNKFNLSSCKKFDCLSKVILGDNNDTHVEDKGKLHCYFGLGDHNDRFSKLFCYTAQCLVYSKI